MAMKNLGIFIIVIITTILAQANLIPAANVAPLHLPGPQACRPGAKEYIVGDCKGWAPGVDYVAWSRDKKFYVGDRLVFRYDISKHDVACASEPQINLCCTKNLQPFPQPGCPNQVNILTLNAPGPVGFMSTKGHDCTNGMKFYIENVQCRP